MIKSLLITLVCALVLTVTGTGLWAWQGLQSLHAPVSLDEPVLFEVPSGSAFGHVADAMTANGLVQDSFWLKLHARVYPEHARIKAGEYEFVSGMSANDMLQNMVDGRIKTWSVQFIEGWRFSDVREVLAGNDRLKVTTGDWSDEQVMAALGAENEHPEGRFFPDTYLYSSKDSDLDVLRRAFEKMNLVLAEEWENRAEGLPYESAYEALIMASIVERETGVAHERDEVAGVFVRRLQRGMRLQTDPTVIYGMGNQYQGRIGRKDLQTMTPYNTYRISGLPPTPIALPGREAIHATLNPGEGDALYFVAKGDGTHQFSRSLKEHQKAVRAYQLKRRSDYRSSPPPTPDQEEQE
ncbi:endolytic transglycosylase MltG [Marinobacter caseinilyticus]|uniref:endolytic transglycosylase MltG n=1 Tax=Marinobacter caseinilyticus TaxID=2692195 RepID=UPI00140A2ED4|nr:endolytic transglycosylase MltG [Marinobacter caseinilyticus]